MRVFALALSTLVYSSHAAEFLTKANQSLARKDGQPDALQEFEEKEKAKEYMDKWRGKSWEKSRLSCDVDMLPRSTDSVIFNICGSKADDGDKCICNIAKAHSCHAGCRKVGKVCPKQCHNPQCGQGAPVNGGSELDGGGNNGKCLKYCSSAYNGFRFCGAGPDYMNGMFVDCSGCAPGMRFEDMSAGEKKNSWTTCMADCFPTPSCQEMCGEGTKECYDKCVTNYKAVVEPYWEIFKGSLQAHPLEMHEPVSKGSVQLNEEAGQEALEEQFAEMEGDVKLKKQAAEGDVQLKEMKEEVPTKEMKEEVPPKKHAEDMAAEEEPWEDPWGDEDDEEYYDDDEYYDDEGDGDGDEEWEDPWGDEDDEEYYLNFHAKRVHRPSGIPGALKLKVQSSLGGAAAVAGHTKHKRHRRARRHHANGAPKRKRREDPWKFYGRTPKAVGKKKPL